MRSLALPDPARRLLSRVLHSRWTLVLAVSVCLAHLQMVSPKQQWDFLVYYHAAQAWRAGGNPYDLAALTRADGLPVTLPYVYPPVTLWLFRAFTALDFASAAGLYLVLKLAALAALLGVWMRCFVRDAASRLLLVVLCLYAFQRPLRVDLLAGNIAIFEQLVVWSALSCLLAGRRVAFALLLALSACFKVVTLGLLPLVWVLHRRRDSWAVMALGAGLVLAVLLSSAVLQPELFTGFRHNVGALDERRADNPATWVLLQNMGDALREEGVAVPRGTELALYAAFVLAVLAVAVVQGRRLFPDRDALRLLSLYLLAYGLVMPRFKDYSYALLLVPATLVLREGFRIRPLFTLLVLATVLAGRSDPFKPVAAMACLFVLACLPGRPEDEPTVMLPETGELSSP